MTKLLGDRAAQYYMDAFLNQLSRNSTREFLGEKQEVYFIPTSFDGGDLFPIFKKRTSSKKIKDIIVAAANEAISKGA